MAIIQSSKVRGPLFLGILYLFLSLLNSISCYAATIDSGTLDFYNQSGIYYYDPSGQKDCSPSSSTSTAPGTTNADKIWNFFVEADIPGVSDNIAVIAGIMGNLQQESTFNPFVVNSSGYIGLVQWGGSRKSTLQSLMSQAGLDGYWSNTNAPDDAISKAIEIELTYLIQEQQFQNFASKLDNVDNKTGEAGAESYSDLFLVIVEGAYGGSSTLIDSYVQSLTSRSNWQEANKRRDYAKEIYKKYQSYSAPASGKFVGTGDYNAIMKAKNADKQYTDFPPATFSDGDSESMKTLLENYGDLAYQLGRVVGAPWIAILVQMRYEDPNSVCGRNNFWGNGCPPGTPAGGANIQGKNLGEGFQQYGKTLTNGYHDQALGVTDPITYLEKIDPTWVQGNVNGAGYGNIEGMRNSVKSLQTFVNSPEGQAIVKNFTNYSPSLGMSSNCIPLSGASNIGEAANISNNERVAWLFDGNGFPTRESVMQQYITSIEVPILNESGVKTTMRLTVHKKLASEITSVFEDMVAAGFRVKSSDTYAYNWRIVTGGSSLSQHSFGVAIDINSADNPYYSNTSNISVYNPSDTRSFHINDQIVQIWYDHGFYWGGCFGSNIDIMHFSYTEKPRSTRYKVCEQQVNEK